MEETINEESLYLKEGNNAAHLFWLNCLDRIENPEKETPEEHLQDPDSEFYIQFITQSLNEELCAILIQ